MTQNKYAKLQNVELTQNVKKDTKESADSKNNADSNLVAPIIIPNQNLDSSYNHTKPEPRQNVSKEIKSLIKDVDTLKKKIVNLKVENDIKINILVKVQLAELEEIRNEK